MKFWIARDLDGELFLYTKKPYQKTIGIWTCEHQEYIWIDSDMFTEVTYENSPIEVELKLIESKKDNNKN